MNTNQVKDMLRKKFEARYGIESKPVANHTTTDQTVMTSLREKFRVKEKATVPVDQEGEVNYTKLSAQVKALEKEIGEAEDFIKKIREDRKAQVMERGKKDISASPNTHTADIISRKVAQELLSVDSNLLKDNEFVETLKLLDEKRSQYNQLLSQKVNFETENASVLEQLRQDKVKAQLRKELEEGEV